ncbi:DUF1064 domain-containing protein [Azospirillum sp. B510]|uniref:DUF1064 domain-containing protein n=1 Tax=Azospirillum sp. (strain B510) TaxID=137722 RepID=UPI0002DB8783|nr:DUF1064 domain-containing protein [Azospirillum sp. B510]
MARRGGRSKGQGVHVPSHVPSLGPSAQRQIEAFLIAQREQRLLRAAGVGQQPAEPKSKYRARRTVVDGISFASALEANRWSVLRQRERLGLIRELVRQPKFPLHVNGVLVCTYIGDFSYRTSQGVFVLEDAKGYLTDVYKLKKRLLEALHPNLRITEVKSCQT